MHEYKVESQYFFSDMHTALSRSQFFPGHFSLVYPNIDRIKMDVVV